MTRIRVGHGNPGRRQGEMPVEQAAPAHAAGCVPPVEGAGPYGAGVFGAGVKRAEEAGGLSTVAAERDMLRSRLNDAEEARDRALGLAS